MRLTNLKFFRCISVFTGSFFYSRRIYLEPFLRPLPQLDSELLIFRILRQFRQNSNKLIVLAAFHLPFFAVAAKRWALGPVLRPSIVVRFDVINIRCQNPSEVASSVVMTPEGVATQVKAGYCSASAAE
jgi:hypothetical protein